jgi:urease accessory protein
MLTRIEVVADPIRDRCVLTTGDLSPRRLPAPAGVVRIALVAAGALLLAGDQVRIEVVVRGDVRLEIVETAGTVAYSMRGGSARWDVAVELTDGATLTWHGEPFIVSEGADVVRTMSISLDVNCSAALRESLVLGRHGEEGGNLHTIFRAFHGDALLLAEELDLSPGSRRGWAVLGEARCLDSVTTLGFRLPESPQTLQLEGAGSIARRLVSAQHESDLAEVWIKL